MTKEIRTLHNKIEVDLDENYEFTIAKSIIPDYKMCSLISEWIHTNLTNLTDDNDNKLFNKVNYGYNEDTLKTFGKKPTCDVYVDNIDYDEDITESRPLTAHSIIIFYVKGANDAAYIKTCQIHDYIMQQFIENPNWKELDNIVRNTVITNSQVMNQTINKKWGVMGAFELEHQLY